MTSRAFCLAAATGLAVSSLGTNALAQSTGAAACGNIEALAFGECHAEFSGGCKAKCTPVNLTVACDGQCNASIDASCTAECTGACNAECNANPGSFNCSASCQADCKAAGEAQCADSQCTSYLEADCKSQCDAECNVVGPSADCEAQCNGCCTGSCDVQANFDCSLQCSADLQGGCEAQCDAPQGAIFCDGKYIHVTDFGACVDYLLSQGISVDIEFEASASASVSGCSLGDPRTSGGGFAFLLAGVGYVFWRRRRGF
jgi:MYXO-CTERM domain-containing protein